MTPGPAGVAEPALRGAPAPTREDGLARLAAFLPDAGRTYAARRNFDLPGHPGVSGLSPWLRHRLLTEAEVVRAVLARHTATDAEKFLQEVFWRTYWKGWLERRPGVWTAYRAGLRAALDRVATEEGLRRRWQDACAGQTGIAGFDDWARDLAATGYLHNHARMWFASIWVFTLRLPWELGADFFLRHLLDGDPASNTLSWRWVAGIHTRGKIYVATADNIARFTGGRFAPHGLAEDAGPLPFAEPPAPLPPPTGDAFDPQEPFALLLTEEDLSPCFLWEPAAPPVGTAVLTAVAGRSPLAVAPMVARFTHGAVADTLARLGRAAGAPGPVLAMSDATDQEAAVMADTLANWARGLGTDRIATPYAPVGPVAGQLATLRPLLAARGVRLITVLRDEDRRAWQHTTRGFFHFRTAIPDLCAAIRGSRDPG